MKNMRKIKIKVACEMTVLIPSYEKKSLDREAIRQVKNWIHEALETKAEWIPLYVEPDDKTPAFIEDAVKIRNLKTRIVENNLDKVYE